MSINNSVLAKAQHLGRDFLIQNYICIEMFCTTNNFTCVGVLESVVTVPFLRGRERACCISALLTIAPVLHKVSNGHQLCLTTPAVPHKDSADRAKVTYAGSVALCHGIGTLPLECNRLASFHHVYLFHRSDFNLHIHSACSTRGILSTMKPVAMHATLLAFATATCVVLAPYTPAMNSLVDTDD